MNIQELLELHNDNPLAPDKIAIKRETLSEYQSQTADLYNIPSINFKHSRIF